MPVSNESDCLVNWFENHYRCPECSTEWTDEWSCMCDDRCPECDLELTPIDSVDLSRPLTPEDYEGAARRIAAFGHPIDYEIEQLPVVTTEQAREYAVARLEGR